MLLLAVVVLVLQAVLVALVLVMLRYKVTPEPQMLVVLLHGMCLIQEVMVFHITKLQVVGVEDLVGLVEILQEA